MINRDFKRSKQLHPCTACLQYAPCSTAHLLTYAPAQLLACLRTHSAQLLTCVLRTVSSDLPAYRRTCNPSVLAYRRTWNDLCLRMYALFFHCACVPSGIDKFQDFKNNPDNQIYRSGQAPKRSQSISRFALFRSRHYSQEIIIFQI